MSHIVAGGDMSVSDTLTIVLPITFTTNVYKCTEDSMSGDAE